MPTDALKTFAEHLATERRADIAAVQGGVGTFADHALLDVIAQLKQLGADRPWHESLNRLSQQVDLLREGAARLTQIARRRAAGRFVAYEQRATDLDGIHGGSDVGYFDMVMSQGVTECLRWRGLPLFKTVYDFSLYPMILSELAPATIIELGSGTGASAVWMADLVAAHQVTCQIYSVDLEAPALTHPHVRFLAGDCRAIESVIEVHGLAAAPHPWLVVEDAHANVPGVLACFHQLLRPGDYLIVEDSASKQQDIAEFLRRVPDDYLVDTRYTDFFGRNATCAQDSIFVRSAPSASVHPGVPNARS